MSFAIGLIIDSDFSSYLSSTLIAFSFVILANTLSSFSTQKSVSGIGISFANIYANLIMIVYFAQITTLRNADLSIEAIFILSYEKFGLFFNYNLPGYGIMALSTLFIGLAITPANQNDNILKYLLIIHGIFFIPCFILPIMGIFSSGKEWIGIVALISWCVYFILIDILSFLHFKNNS